MSTNPERFGSSSTPAPPTYFSAPAPTVREDILNVQADSRLAAHLRETPAPHILEEDAEPNEDLAGNDFTYSQDTTTAFQELLNLIDSNTRELPTARSPFLPSLRVTFVANSRSINSLPWAGQDAARRSGSGKEE